MMFMAGSTQAPEVLLLARKKSYKAEMHSVTKVRDRRE